MILRLAHISDLHFSKATYSPLQFFSKRWLGNINLIFSRKRNFLTERIEELIPLFHQKKITHVLITGDLTTTSRSEEFTLAAKFIHRLQEEGWKVFVLPGNHDQYTKSAYRKQLFYHFFPEAKGLQETRVAQIQLAKGWQLVLLDTAIATSLISSQGYFSPSLQKQLHKVLASIPEGERVILANHFPLFERQSRRKKLLRSNDLRKLLQSYPHVVLYLHGHTHIHSVADLRPNQLPIVLDAGSASFRRNGSWNLLTLHEKGCDVDAFFWRENGWHATQKRFFSW